MQPEFGFHRGGGGGPTSQALPGVHHFGTGGFVGPTFGGITGFNGGMSGFGGTSSLPFSHGHGGFGSGSGGGAFNDSQTRQYVQSSLNHALSEWRDTGKNTRKTKQNQMLVRVSRSDILEINNRAKRDPSISAAIKIIPSFLLGRKLYFLHKKFKLKPEYHNMLRTHWESFITDYIVNTVLYGVVIVHISKHPLLREKPAVLPLGLNDIQFRINPETNEYEYIVINLLTGEVRDDVYVVDKFKPEVTGELTSPIAELLDHRRWVQFVRNEYNLSTYYRGRPDIILQEPAPVRMAPTIHDADRNFPVPGASGGSRSVEAKEQEALAMGMTSVYQGASPAYISEYESKLTLDGVNASGQRLTPELAAKMRQAAQHPSKRAYVAEYNPMFQSRIMRTFAGHHYARPQLPQTPDYFEFIMKRMDELIGRVLNVPKEFWTGDHSSARYNSGNERLAWESLKTTITGWATDVESLCNMLLCHIYGATDAILSAEIIYEEIMASDLSEREKKQMLKIYKRTQEIADELMDWYIVPEAATADAIHKNVGSTAATEDSTLERDKEGDIVAKGGKKSQGTIRKQVAVAAAVAASAPSSSTAPMETKVKTEQGASPSGMPSISQTADASGSSIAEPRPVKDLYGPDRVEDYLHEQKSKPTPPLAHPNISMTKKNSKMTERRQDYDDLVLELTRLHGIGEHTSEYSFVNICLVLGWTVYVSDSDLSANPKFAIMENMSVASEQEIEANARTHKFGHMEAHFLSGMGTDALHAAMPDASKAGKLDKATAQAVVDKIVSGGYVDVSQKEKMLLTLGEDLHGAMAESRAAPQARGGGGGGSGEGGSYVAASEGSATGSSDSKDARSKKTTNKKRGGKSSGGGGGDDDDDDDDGGKPQFSAMDEIKRATLENQLGERKKQSSRGRRSPSRSRSRSRSPAKAHVRISFGSESDSESDGSEGSDSDQDSDEDMKPEASKGKSSKSDRGKSGKSSRSKHRGKTSKKHSGKRKTPSASEGAPDSDDDSSEPPKKKRKTSKSSKGSGKRGRKLRYEVDADADADENADG